MERSCPHFRSSTRKKLRFMPTFYLFFSSIVFNNNQIIMPSYYRNEANGFTSFGDSVWTGQYGVLPFSFCLQYFYSTILFSFDDFIKCRRAGRRIEKVRPDSKWSICKSFNGINTLYSQPCHPPGRWTNHPFRFISLARKTVCFHWNVIFIAKHVPTTESNEPTNERKRHRQRNWNKRNTKSFGSKM